MDNSNIFDDLNTEEKLDNTEKDINKDLDSINISFDDAYEFDTETGNYVKRDSSSGESDKIENTFKFDIEENLEETSLTTLKERRLLAAQTMFKKSIKVSLKSFLISLSLTFLNLFI